MGIFDWGRKKTKDGVDFGKKVVGVEEIKKNAEDISELAKKFLSPREQVKNAKKETFLEAKERLGVSDLDIIKTYKNNVYSFYISFLFAILCFASVVYNLFILKQIMGAISSLAVMAICLANSFRFSFRAFQIKHQKLCSVKEWWNRANEWFPKLP